jgi:hypothetical protein
MVRYVSEFAALLTQYGAELVLVSPFNFANALSKLVGIELPISNIDVSRSGSRVTISITYLNDISPIVAQIIAFLVASFVGATVALLIDRIVFGGQVQVKYDANAIIQQTTDLKRRAIENCKSISTSPDQYMRCIEASAEFIQKTSTYDIEVVRNAANTISSLKDENNTLKLLIVLAGLALVVGIARG